MKKLVRVMLCALLACCIVFPTVACDSCGKNKTLDNEQHAFVVATQELDEMFNPFFATSGYDTSVVGMTQISMLSSDANGALKVGNDEPTVVLDYNQITVDQRTDIEKAYEDLEQIKRIDLDRFNTTYNFVLKNGIKFSDGSDLTIKDVLFNIYIYLDPAYTGSSTMYSTDIVGLDAYRTQDVNGDADKQESIQRTAGIEANARIQALLDFYFDDGKDHPGGEISSAIGDTTKEKLDNLQEDLNTVRKTFRDELKTDWGTASSTLEDYKEDYVTPNALIANSKNPQGFTYENAGKVWVTEPWQYFLIRERAVNVRYDPKDTDVVIEVNYGNYPKYVEEFNTRGNEIRNELKGKMSEADFKYYGEFMELGDYLCYLIYDGMVGGEEISINDPNTGSPYEGVKVPKNVRDTIDDILNGWMTGSTVRQTFVADAITNYFEDSKKDDGSLEVTSVSGITYGDKDEGTGVIEFDAGTCENGVWTDENHHRNYSEPHSVLTVKIRGIDPKAIWNFGFSVTPMSYYSNPDATNDINGNTGYTTERDGYKAYNPEKGHYGFPFADSKYFNDVIKSRLVPMGAGTYKATTVNDYDGPILAQENGKWVEKIEKKSTSNGFFGNQTVYYIRNEYFKTVSETGEIGNAKIKHFNYKVISSNRLYDAVTTGDVMFSDPSAQTTTVQKIQQDIDNGSSVKQLTQLNNGYGYIGINAKYVRDIEVRRAIMYAMDTSLCADFYGSLATIIYRPMTQALKDYYPFDKNTPKYDSRDASGKFSMEVAQDKIEHLLDVRYGGKYSKNDKGIYTRTDSKLGTLTLKFTFTVAGGETDHPAYSTISRAADILNMTGFQVKVVTDSQALSKLASGSLEVWAAAWSSGIDPDMYQVYHKNSKATSILNWGYDEMLGLNGLEAKGSSEELDIINRLSNIIDLARSTTVVSKRADYYEQALELVMDLAVELPTYQRNNIYVFDSAKIDENTLVNQSDITAYQGPIDKLWNVSFVGNN